ncbi:hypothetical protein [Microbacterium sp. T32]|uniref:hypothetical protein n=1 Tax=Microbacterium sp. T32 TaxID=1776083 RepID=UPI0007ABC288|nr:hypothetical protein [Microbacterium sp. T32]KZE41345.1 hypothetical protein AVW09_01815 [Microbacterium sp. T32]
MTLVRLRGRVPGFGQLEALPAGTIAIERWSGTSPASLVSGQNYIPDTILRTAMSWMTAQAWPTVLPGTAMGSVSVT